VGTTEECKIPHLVWDFFSLYRNDESLLSKEEG